MHTTRMSMHVRASQVKDFCYVVNNPHDFSHSFCLPVLVITYLDAAVQRTLSFHPWPKVPIEWDDAPTIVASNAPAQGAWALLDKPWSAMFRWHWKQDGGKMEPHNDEINSLQNATSRTTPGRVDPTISRHQSSCGTSSPRRQAAEVPHRLRGKPSGACALAGGSRSLCMGRGPPCVYEGCHSVFAPMCHSIVWCSPQPGSDQFDELSKEHRASQDARREARTDVAVLQ